ncbi:MAG: efflux RND transporter periplasmic adaptor subunit [Steroidobacteraceae bacterium]|nr:efflux RND transporter periplasmic adaptor subunit [Steroidobacteraceae bacterium]MCW5573009.1 efflux RND transporter periplasmic adaptor subunit [Steroidobacteraceae bacterium]
MAEHAVKRLPRLAIVGGLVVLVALGAWWWAHDRGDDELVLYGNVDVRQVSLAFNTSERVAEMRAQEGDQVRQGEVLAVLDTATLALRIAQAEAQLEAQDSALRRLEAGNRPEEIAQARANLAAAEAGALEARDQLQRLRTVSSATSGRAVSRQELDAATAALEVAQARALEARKQQELAVAGPRSEDIAQARAQRDAASAALALMRQQLADAELKAPVDAVVRSRLLEPGDMASPQRPAYALAITQPKWVRAYVAESDLARVRPGQVARVAVDGVPQPFEGRVGFIASVAEFTPKNVQTEDLRTSLVYELRVNVDDPDDRLRLGMPATVRFPQ